MTEFKTEYLNKPIIKCAYCNNDLTDKESIQAPLIFRRNGQVLKEYLTYCKDKPCASRNQMAHEG